MNKQIEYYDLHSNFHRFPIDSICSHFVGSVTNLPVDGPSWLFVQGFFLLLLKCLCNILAHDSYRRPTQATRPRYFHKPPKTLPSLPNTHTEKWC